MPPKRKSDATAAADLSDGDDFVPGPVSKKPRPSDATEGASSSKTNDTGDAPKRWQDVRLETDADGSVPICDDCNEVRRKIRLLQKDSNWKVTHWLKEIGNVNNNSYGRFMREKGPSGGAANGTYYAAYVYFEKVRIAEGKKKTPKRKKNEKEHHGFDLRDRSTGWVFTGP